LTSGIYNVHLLPILGTYGGFFVELKIYSLHKNFTRGTRKKRGKRLRRGKRESACATVKKV
jgi:hypothetical protein